MWPNEIQGGKQHQTMEDSVGHVQKLYFTLRDREVTPGMEQGAGPEDPPQKGLGAGRLVRGPLWVTQVREEVGWE